MMVKRSLDIIFAGSGEFGVPTLRALAGSGHRVVKVVSQPDRPAGRVGVGRRVCEPGQRIPGRLEDFLKI